MNASALHAAWTLWAAVPVAFLGVIAMTPIVIRWAHRTDRLAYPKSDRWHSTPTALLGGIGIFGAVTLGLLVGAQSIDPWWVWGGASVMFATGLIDDLYDIRPIGKLLAQVAATAFLLGGDYAFGADWPFWLSVPVTFLWVIGVTNALNLLDNMDGLAAGIAAIVASVLAAFAVLSGSPSGSVLGLVVAGAAGGFLVYNFKPARIFMGDCGSLFLGYLIAAVALIIQDEAVTMNAWAGYLIPVAALAVPIFDTTFVTAVRTLAGRAVSQGGQDHTSHRLVFLGLSEKNAVLVLYGISVMAGGLVLLFLFVETPLFYALTLFVAVGLAVFGIYLSRANVYHEQETRTTPTIDKSPAASRWMQLPRVIFGSSWKIVFGALADLLLVIAAFICAFYLRFENGLSATHTTLLQQALPGVAFLKVTVFYGTGLYQGIWRHAGTPEIIRIVKATVLSSLLVFGVLTLWFGLNRISPAVLFIDWLIVTVAVTAVRFGFRGMRQYLAFQRTDGTRTLLYGAGDAGVLVLREMRQNPNLGLSPVGFIDDDSFKQGQVVQGLRVLGGGNDLQQICEKYDVEEVLITTFRMDEEHRQAVVDACHGMGVSCRLFYFKFESLRPTNERVAAPKFVSSRQVRT